MKNILLLLAASASLHADVIYSSIVGIGQAGYGIYGSDRGPISMAAKFTPTAADTVASASVVIEGFDDSGPTFGPNFNLYLYSDSGGLPGVQLDQFGASLYAPNNINQGAIVSGLSTTQAALEADTSYWLVVGPADPSTDVRVQIGGSAVAPLAINLGTGWLNATADRLQFEVEGTAPEPSSLPLGLAGLGSLALLQVWLRRRR
jgi:hypothetical protein